MPGIRPASPHDKSADGLIAARVSCGCAAALTMMKSVNAFDPEQLIEHLVLPRPILQWGEGDAVA
jgi:hypothetical protein